MTPIGKRTITAIWWMAALFAVINGLFVLRRVPILRAESVTPDERAAQAASVWLRDEPVGSRILLLRSHRDIGAVWFGYRLNYLIYPILVDSAWETLPDDAARRYDRILAIGAARADLLPTAPRLHRTDFADLIAASASPAPASHPQAAPRRLNTPAILAGIVSLAVVPLLGALLMGATLNRAPLRTW